MQDLSLIFGASLMAIGLNLLFKLLENVQKRQLLFLMVVSGFMEAMEMERELVVWPPLDI